MGMKNWDLLEPDKVLLLDRHFTPGRGGRSIKHVTLHHMAMVGGVEECVRVWRDREASGHYCINPDGVIGQAVWDRDTAWGNANLVSNQETIIIEHSNSAGAAADWPISDKTLEEGAHLVAAICKYYNLGRPVSGVNVRYHSVESGGSTACPYHLRPGHKYNAAYIARAQWWYDQMTGVAPQPAAPTVQPVTQQVRDAALNDAKLAAFAARDLLRDQNAPITSLINPAVKFSPRDLVAVVDATGWTNQVLLKAICRKLDLDPEKLIADAISVDRANKK